MNFKIGDMVLYRLKDDSATRPAVVTALLPDDPYPARLRVFLDQPADREASEAFSKGGDGCLGFLRYGERAPGEPAPGCWCARLLELTETAPPVAAPTAAAGDAEPAAAPVADESPEIELQSLDATGEDLDAPPRTERAT